MRSVSQRDCGRERIERVRCDATLRDGQKVDSRNVPSVGRGDAGCIQIGELDSVGSERPAHWLHDVAGRRSRRETVEVAEIPAGVGGAIELVARAPYDSEQRARLDGGV